MISVRELMGLSGRRALITGAAGGIGRVMADSLAELGADLVLLDMRETDLTELSAALEDRWRIGTRALVCDLEDETARQDAVERIRSDGAGLDILVNNAAFVGTSGLSGWVERFEDQTLETWRRAIEVNLTAAFHLCQEFAPELRASKGGSIVNVASVYGELGPDWSLYDGTAMGNPAAYGASKGGLIQLTRWLSTTLAPQVRVNAISPGGVARGQPEAFVERYRARTPLGRMAQEDDFRGAIVYLASDLSRYVTGQVLRVDGGWGAW